MRLIDVLGTSWFGICPSESKDIVTSESRGRLHIRYGYIRGYDGFLCERYEISKELIRNGRLFGYTNKISFTDFYKELI